MPSKLLPSSKWVPEKYMSYNVKGIDDEDVMVVAMKAIKAVNPKIATYFYMNAFKDRPEMIRMARQLDEHPDYYLCESSGMKVKNYQGFYVFDLSKPDVRKWWLKTCLNATKYADGDGCLTLPCFKRQLHSQSI